MGKRRSQKSLFRGLVICVVGPHYPRPGGVSTQVEVLERSLRAEGAIVRPVDTNVQALRRLGRLGKWLLPAAQVVIVPLRLWRAAGGADLIHAHLASYWGFYLPMLAVTLVRRLRGVPAVATYHGGKAAEFAAAHRTSVRVLLNRLDALIVLSPFTGGVFERLGLQPFAIPNVVEQDLFLTNPPGSGSSRLADPDRPALLWIKSFDAAGNPALMVEAFSRLRHDLPGATLTMIGDGPQRPTILATAAAQHLPIEFPGRLAYDAMRYAYDKADILVISSAVDNQPNVLIEASACGLPVVATTVGGIPDMAQDGVNALLVASGRRRCAGQRPCCGWRAIPIWPAVSVTPPWKTRRHTPGRVPAARWRRCTRRCFATCEMQISMAEQPRTALITGAAGFCGSYLTELLLAQGIRVIGVDQVGSSEQTGEYRLESLDLRDEAAVRRVLAVVQPDWLVHLAALTNPAAPISDLYAVNVFATIGLLDAVKELVPGCTVLITGSSAQYGVTTPEENPISETQVFRPVTQYAVTKATQDLIGGMVSAAGLPLIRSRTFNIIGPRKVQPLSLPPLPARSLRSNTRCVSR